MLLTDWGTIKNIAIVGIVTYLMFIIVLRISGKRTLSQMNVYDFSVTVALGSILASTITNANTAALSGIFSFTLLVVFQYIIAKLAVHLQFFNKLIKSEPSLLFYKGQYDWENMKKQRVTQDDFLQELRQQQCSSTDDILAVVMEASGKLSILKKTDSFPANNTLRNIQHRFLEEDPEYRNENQ
ncbi:DUF421 domain-containing protein [Jeotgalibaca sp. MA1X17-3]|uniref:DUF421 domain-containing protein n=1 Tax=Jeotgalibaca sp. MA1X17-3 TaxID=2908211 RepID=UPI001F1B701F|nr:YetF domain-containing protein [Jeotgalibaca sp. MA1X17-3]UJF16389.1 DUF421 domain-containing protein [Jeotgalibaca sp. MA1X17-3]